MRPLALAVLLSLAACSSWTLRPPPSAPAASGQAGSGGEPEPVAGTGGFSEAEACDQPDPDDQVAAAVFRSLRPHVRAGETIGAGVAVVRDGAITFAGGLGSESHLGCRPIMGGSTFQASLGEMIAASVVLAADAAGKVALEAPVREVVPELQDADPPVSPAVTLRQVMAGTSGLAGDSLDLRCAGSFDGTLADYVRHHAWQTLHAPGALYLDPQGSTLSGLGVLAVQDATGEPYAMAARHLLLDSLGIQAGLTLDSVATVEAAFPLQICESNALLVVNASAEDAARLLQAVVGPSSLLGPRWRLLYDAGQPYIFEPVATTGLFPFVMVPATGGTRLTWALYQSAGTETGVLLWPDRGSGLIIVTPAMNVALDALFAGEAALGLATEYADQPPPVRIAGLPATYRSAQPTGTWRGERAFVVEPAADDLETMVMSIGSFAYRLTPDAHVPDLFRFAYGGNPQEVRFWRNADGQAFALSGPLITPPAFRDPPP